MTLTGVLGALVSPHVDEHNYWARPGCSQLQARVRRELLAHRDAGLLESGRFRDRSSVHWRFTPAGLARLQQLELPDTVPSWTYRGDRQHVSTADTLERITEPQPLFEEQREQLTPTWIAERKAARARGRRAYKTWLRQKRAATIGVRSEIVFEDDEIVDALAAAVRKHGGPVASEDLREELAPGQPTASERAIVSQQLVRLARTGRIERARNGSRLAWKTTEAPQR